MSRVYAGALAICFGLVSACGQKGPLYLPPRNGTVVTRPPSPQTPPPADKDNKKNNDDTAQQPK